MRRQVQDVVVDRALAWALALGFMLAAALDLVLAEPLWAVAVPMAIGAALFPWALSSNQTRRTWRLRHMLRGADAERRTGQVLEWALVRPGCAIAHGAEVPGTVGDIDHLVATRGTVHVIETKAERVPKKRFPGVLAQLAHNVRAVRAWTPTGTTVRGVLAIASDRGMGTEPKQYDSDGERITVYGKSALERHLALSLRTTGAALTPTDRELARRVWQAGAGEGPTFERRPVAWGQATRFTVLVVAVTATTVIMEVGRRHLAQLPAGLPGLSALLVDAVGRAAGMATDFVQSLLARGSP